MYSKVFDEKAISKNYVADRTCFANISRPFSHISISRLCASMHAEYNLTASKILNVKHVILKPRIFWFVSIHK